MKQRTVYATPFDPETLRPTAASTDSGFSDMEQAAEAMGPGWIKKRPGMLIYPAGSDRLCLSYAVIHIDRPDSSE